MCKVYSGYHGTSEIEHGLCTSPLAKARGLSLRTGAQTMLYLSLKIGENSATVSPLSSKLSRDGAGRTLSNW